MEERRWRNEEGGRTGKTKREDEEGRTKREERRGGTKSEHEE
jgi:hypothetical protein